MCFCCVLRTLNCSLRVAAMRGPAIRTRARVVFVMGGHGVGKTTQAARVPTAVILNLPDLVTLTSCRSSAVVDVVRRFDANAIHTGPWQHFCRAYVAVASVTLRSLCVCGV